MDTIDPQGRITPLVPPDQQMVTRKVEDKEGHGQGPKYLAKPKTPTSGPPAEDEEKKPDNQRLIDIVV